MTAPMTMPPRIVTGDAADVGDRRVVPGHHRGRRPADPARRPDLRRRDPAHRFVAEAARGVAGGARMSTFVLVHGAWHGGWCWDRVAPRLAERRPPRDDADVDRPRRAPAPGGRRGGPRHPHHRRPQPHQVRGPARRRAGRAQLRGVRGVRRRRDGRGRDRPARAARRLRAARRRDDGRSRRRARRAVPRGSGRGPGLPDARAAGGRARRRRGRPRVGRATPDAPAGRHLPAAARRHRRRSTASPRRATSPARPRRSRCSTSPSGGSPRRAGRCPSSPAGTTRWSRCPPS